MPETGEVIFPTLEPFGDDLPPSFDYNTDIILMKFTIQQKLLPPKKNKRQMDSCW
ncbi:MAG: hypothetical protein MZV64_46955 [Ignavibacteriales bacterium]|nr:hypothetical protein [Ignavibacteriales bacterium]